MSNPFYTDFSMTSAYLRCPKYYYYRYKRHLVPMVTAAPLTFGKAWHEALEAVHKSKQLKEVIETFNKSYANETNDLVRTPEKGEIMLTKYYSKYKDDKLTFLYSETPFALAFPNNVIMCGKMDGIIEDHGGVYVFESKTTSRLGSTYFQQFDMNYQIDIYCLGCLEILGRCNGALIDAARVVKTPVKDDDFMRYKTSRTESELEYAKENLMNITEKMQQEPYYQDKTKCTFYGTCPYHDICMSRENQRVIDRMYREEVWDPSHGLEKEVNNKA